MSAKVTNVNPSVKNKKLSLTLIILAFISLSLISTSIVLVLMLHDGVKIEVVSESNQNKVDISTLTVSFNQYEVTLGLDNDKPIKVDTNCLNDFLKINQNKDITERDIDIQWNDGLRVVGRSVKTQKDINDRVKSTFSDIISACKSEDLIH